MRITALAVLIAVSISGKAQKVDSIFFHLYTDSLKKGTYNYINVDGKFSNGHWLPLTSKELSFSATAGRFEGNSLIIEKDQREQRITIKAVLKADSSIVKEMVIYIKKNEETERLKTQDDVMKPQGKRRNK